MSLDIRALTLSLLIGSYVFSFTFSASASARNVFTGPRGGRVSYGGGPHYGPNGGYVNGGGAYGIGPYRNAGFAAGAHSAVGPNGSTFNGNHAGAFRKGLGYYNHDAYSAQGANGNNLNHNSNSGYNALTGKGFAQGSNSGTYNGKQIGDQYNFTGQKGQGAQGTVDTDNHGDYSVQVPAGGGKPIVTQTQAPVSP